MKSRLIPTLLLLLLLATGAYAQEIAARAFSEGRKAFDAEEYEKAVGLFDKAAETDPKNPEVYIWKGNALLALGRIDEAAVAWQKALAIAPNNATLKKRLDNLTAATKNVDSKIRLIQQLLDMRLPSPAYFIGFALQKTALTKQQKMVLDLLVIDALEKGRTRPQEALMLIIEWQSRYPNATANLATRAMFIHIRILIHMKNTDVAHKKISELIAKYPSTAAALKARFEKARLHGNQIAVIKAYTEVLADKNTAQYEKEFFVFEARVFLIGLITQQFDKPTEINDAPALATEHLFTALDPKDDVKISQLVQLLKHISQHHNKTSPGKAIAVIEKFANMIDASSLYHHDIALILAESYYQQGVAIFSEDSALPEKANILNAAFIKAIDAYLSVKRVNTALNVVRFYRDQSLNVPAIAACERILTKTPGANDAILHLVASLNFEQEKVEAGQYLRAHRQLPEKLGDSATKALQYIKTFWQEKRDKAISKQMLTLANMIAKFYADQGYFDVARSAYDVLSPDNSNSSPLTQFARYGKANITKIEADIDFARKAKLRDGITGLTELHKKAITEMSAVTTASSPIDRAVAIACFVKAQNRIAEIARQYECQGAFETARNIYLRLGKNTKWLGSEEMRYRAALCLRLKADKAFAKWLANAKQDEKPQQLSAEYKAAIADYIAAIADMPRGFFAPEALRDIRGIAILHARAGAWDIAAEVYSALLDKNLQYRDPEQVKYEIALCELGKAIPEHALKMLELIAWGSAPATYGTTRSIRSEGNEDAPLLDELREIKERLRNVIDETKDSEDKYDYYDNNAYRDTVVKLRELELERAKKIAQKEQQIQQLQHKKANLSGASASKYIIDTPRPSISISAEEIKRRAEIFKQAYAKLAAILRENQGRPIGDKARAEIMVMVNHLRAIGAPRHAAQMLEGFLKDFPQDSEVSSLRLAIANDWLFWAATAQTEKTAPMDRLAEISGRFIEARSKIAALIKDFPDDKAVVGAARRALARSYLTEAQMIGQFSPTQSRGRYLRAAEEFLRLAREHGETLNGQKAFGVVWAIGESLEHHRYWDEAVTVYRLLARQYPIMARSNRAGLKIATIYRDGMRNYLRAVEAYQEYLGANGGDAARVQGTILNIGGQLRSEARWVEALHVYNVFVDSFPRHPQAGEALRAIGEIHQANRAWDEAIRAYKRVIEEYKTGNWAQQAQFAIAECHIQLSQWHHAMWAYTHYIDKYSRTPQAQKARENIIILKEIYGYQQLINEGRSPKCADAQYMIAEIVEKQLHNSVKAIVEYNKVATNYPKSHRVDDALFAAGKLHLAAGDLKRGGEIMLEIFTNHPTSPYADDALYLLGQAYERQADATAGVTLEKAKQHAQFKAQGEFYNQALDLDKKIRDINDEVRKLREEGKSGEAEMLLAGKGARLKEERSISAQNAYKQSSQMIETLAAHEMANRQDKINALLRKAIEAYQKASTVALGDRAADSLLKMAEIYDKRLKDADKAMAVYDKIVRLFPGTSVAEDAVWRRALYFERKGEYKKAKDEYIAFISNYPQSKRVEDASFRLAEMYEHLQQWEDAMNMYRNYLDKFPNGPKTQKARERIAWINTYRL